MSRAARRYQTHIHRQLERLATWLPGDRITLGDVGLLTKGGFRKETHLDALELPFSREDSGVRQRLSCSSTSHVSLGERVEADVAAQASGRATIELSRSGAVVFEARDVRHERIANPAELSAPIQALREADKWQRAWVLIDQVWHVGQGSVLVALSDRVAASFAFDVDAGPQLDAFARSSADLGFAVDSGEVVGEIGATDFTPLYTARKLRFFGGELSPIRSKDGTEDEALTRASVDDLLSSWE